MGKFTYVGLDVHRKSIMAVWGRTQEKTSAMEIPHTPDGVERLIRRIGQGEVWAVYEASGEGYGLHDRLTGLGWRVNVLAPTMIQRSTAQRKRKTDLRDAEQLHGLVMSHGELGTKLPKVWIPDAGTREDRELVRRRVKLAERISSTKTAIRSLLRMHQVEAPEDLKTNWTRKHLDWLGEVAGPASAVRPKVKQVLASYLRELTFVQGEVRAMQEMVETLAAEPRYEAPVRRMTQTGGVGVLTAMVFMTEMGDVHRFQNRRQVGAYMGLVPTCYESGEANDRKGHITRMGSAGIRKTLNQAAWVFLRMNPEWRAWYDQVSRRRGVKRALVGVMRRLGIMLWQKAKAA